MLSSTPSPPIGNNCKQARLFYKTNKYFHTKKNDTSYKFCVNVHWHVSHSSCTRCKQASLLNKTNKYFHMNKNDAGYHKACAISLSLSLACTA
jgi:hypothetical protein